MVMFGSMYYVVPRTSRSRMALRDLDQTSLLVLCLGVGLMVLMLLIGGLAQGTDLKRSFAPIHREHAIGPALSARPAACPESC